MHPTQSPQPPVLPYPSTKYIMRKLPRPSISPNFLCLVAFLTSICIITFLVSTSISPLDRRVTLSTSLSLSIATTTVDHISFGIASSRRSWPSRKNLIRVWWDNRLHGCVFLNKASSDGDLSSSDQDSGSGLLPPICVSGDTSEFRYTYKNGYPDAIRVARLVKETVELNLPGVRWYVFGNDDTIFLPENLAKTLSKYNHKLWYYIGANSEVYEQNKVLSFATAFGGGGFAISSSLANVLAKVLDSCLPRYPHLYGSDTRISYCLQELGVGVTLEPGFHQMDVRGDIFGLLAAHPLTPLISLGQSGHALPIFPNMSHLSSLTHLFRAAKADSERVLQQTICYDHWFSWTISISWGYAVQIFDHHMLLPDALGVQETFSTLKQKGINELSTAYMFDTRFVHVDPCRRPTVLFFDGVDTIGVEVIRSRYRRMVSDNCSFDPMSSPKKVKEVVVFSRKSNLGLEQLMTPRRECCDVLPPSTGDRMEISIRECKEDELTYMHP